MDINQLTSTLYNNKPMPAYSQQISIQGGNTINEQFEIISLVILEGLENKLVRNPTFDTCDDENKFVNQMSILLKLYLASIGVRINIEKLSKKQLQNTKLTHTPNFWADKTYPFELACLYYYTKNGKRYALQYNPHSKLTNFSDGFLVVKIRSHVLKITMKQY
jgi:hypothetical protein